MEMARNSRIKLNYEKCIAKSISCGFLGNIYIPYGVKPDPRQVDVIKRMEPPSSKQEF